MVELAAILISVVCLHWLWAYWIRSELSADSQLVASFARAQETIYMLRGVMESQEAATLIASGDGKIIECTASFERRMGYRRGELPGMNVNIFVPVASREEHDRWVSDFYRDRGALELRPVNALMKDGALTEIALGISKTQPINGAPLLVATIREIDDEDNSDNGLGRHAEDTAPARANASDGTTDQ